MYGMYFSRNAVAVIAICFQLQIVLADGKPSIPRKSTDSVTIGEKLYIPSVIPKDARVGSLRFSADSRLLAVSFYERSKRRADAQSDSSVGIVHVRNEKVGHYLADESARFSFIQLSKSTVHAIPSASRRNTGVHSVVLGSFDGVKDCVSLIHGVWDVQAADFSHSGKYLAIGRKKTDTYTVLGPIAQTFNVFRTDRSGSGAFKLRAELRNVGSVRFAAKSDHVAYGGDDGLRIKGSLLRLGGFVTVLDLRAGKSGRRVKFQQKTVSAVRCVDIDGKARRVVVAMSDESLRVENTTVKKSAVVWSLVGWRTDNRERLFLKQFDEGEIVHSISMSPDGLYVAYATDSRVEVLSIDKGKTHTVNLKHGPASVVKFAPNGKSLVIDDRNGGITQLNFNGERD